MNTFRTLTNGLEGNPVRFHPSWKIHCAICLSKFKHHMQNIVRMIALIFCTTTTRCLSCVNCWGNVSTWMPSTNTCCWIVLKLYPKTTSGNSFVPTCDGPLCARFKLRPKGKQLGQACVVQRQIRVVVVGTNTSTITRSSSSSARYPSCVSCASSLSSCLFSWFA